jgi:hypothetical protein
MADKTKPETTPVPTDLGTARKRKAFTKKRGPRVFVKYEVVDGSGNVIPGAVARLLRVERDQTKILEMTLNHTQCREGRDARRGCQARACGTQG